MDASAETELAFGEDAPIFEVMSTMRAMRRLRPDPVPRETLERLVEAATWAPSGGNSQDYSFVVVDEREPIARLAPIWRKIVRYYTATQSAPEHMSEEKWRGLVRALRYQADHFDEVPALIVACYTMRPTLARTARNWGGSLAASRELGARDAAVLMRNTPRLLSRSEAACIYPAVQNLLLAARALGLGAVLTTWHTFFEQDFKRELGIPRDVQTYAIVPVGWPKGRFGPVIRRPAGDAIHWNRW